MTATVKLSDELANYVDAQVASGRFSSPGDVLKKALRLLEQHEEGEMEKLLWLKSAWMEGVDSGDSGALDAKEFKSEARQRLSRRV